MVARWSRQAWVLISPDPRLRRNDLGIAGIRMVERNPGLKLSAPDWIPECHCSREPGQSRHPLAFCFAWKAEVFNRPIAEPG